MIQKLTLKQKIIGASILIAISIAIGGIGFFIVQEKEETNMSELLNIIENVEQETDKENTQVEEKKKIIVHITGEVKKVGIITLEEGARIADAITVAGGATKEADLQEVNLAYELQDGQKIYIPNKKEKNETKTYITTESGNNVIKQENSSNSTNLGTNKNSQEKGGNIKVNINEARQEELEQLPGIGSSIASRIIEYRKQNGKFQKIEDLQNVKGIGDAKYVKIKDYVTVK